MTPYKFFFAIEYDCFFFVSPLSALSLFFFHCFCLLSEKENHNLNKKTRENKFENKSKNASHKDFTWIKET